MPSVNRAQIRTLARVFANARPAGSNAFLVDSDATANATSLDTLINLRLASLYDLLVSARGHEYYASDTLVPLLPNVATYSLAGLSPPFYELLTVHLEWDATNFEQLQDTSQFERTDFTNYSQWGRWAPKAYRLRGTQAAAASTLEIFPTPTAAVNARVRYVPAFVALADDTTTFDSVNGWEKLVALGAAIDYRAASDKTSTQLQQLYAEEFARITSIADQRAANAPARIVDVRPEAVRSDWAGDRRWIG
jgi:hypothetical protein